MSRCALSSGRAVAGELPFARYFDVPTMRRKAGHWPVNKEASHTRGSCVAEYATHRAACPDPSLRKNACSGMTINSVAQQLCSPHCLRYNLPMPVFEEKQEELEHYETMMGVTRGRLAVTMDSITDAMALVGQNGVYCQSQRWPGKPVMDIQIIMKSLTDAKELIQSVMEELKKNP